ncbi:MAG: serine/threonine protein kinase, partial [Planctomycetaceae bacterium]|nr:serine/threonine protein kinase [Planctomycetaceae bacterium]
QLEHCRRKQTSSANLGVNRTLEDIVLEEGLMSNDEVGKVQRAQRQFIQDREKKADLKFKGYEIISTLGEGGLGTVYKARQVSLNRMVALKVLHKHWISDDEFRKRFVLEARIVGRLSHQNLVQVYDVGREGDYYYFSMEYVDGKTAEELIDESPGKRLDIAEAVDIVIQVVRAIRYYKDLDNIVHRDIKPSNIMLTKSGLVKLGDFGFVKSRLDKELGAEGMVLGTPDYIAPEQAMGKASVDYRADIYALGCSFFHMLTGRPPFEGKPDEVMLKHTREEPPNLKDLRPSISDDVIAVVTKMLAKNPDDRYSNLNILFTDLERLETTHRSKAPLRVEVGKSSALRALKMERAKLNDMEASIHRLEAQVSGFRTRQIILLVLAILGALWGIGATIAALV